MWKATHLLPKLFPTCRSSSVLGKIRVYCTVTFYLTELTNSLSENVYFKLKTSDKSTSSHRGMDWCAHLRKHNCRKHRASEVKTWKKWEKRDSQIEEAASTFSARVAFEPLACRGTFASAARSLVTFLLRLETSGYNKPALVPEFQATGMHQEKCTRAAGWDAWLSDYLLEAARLRACCTQDALRCRRGTCERGGFYPRPWRVRGASFFLRRPLCLRVWEPSPGHGASSGLPRVPEPPLPWARALRAQGSSETGPAGGAPSPRPTSALSGAVPLSGSRVIPRSLPGSFPHLLLPVRRPGAAATAATSK